MASFGWNDETVGAGVLVSGGTFIASRPTDGGGGAYAGVKGLAARRRGNRYFEIQVNDASCAVGLVSISADVDGKIGEGEAPLQWALFLQDGYFYYRESAGSGSVDIGTGALGPGVYGFLIDFNTHSMKIHKDGSVVYSAGLSFGHDVFMYPAVSMASGVAEATLTGAEAFQYPPAVSFVAWDVADAALAYFVAGNMKIDGVVAQRIIRAYSYDSQTYYQDGLQITSSKPLGQDLSDPSTGDYKVVLRDGYDLPVFVVAFDDYGENFIAEAEVNVGDIIHPTSPNGYVYICNASGALSVDEPDPWPTDLSSFSIGTAAFAPREFYRPAVHGPVVPAVEVYANFVILSGYTISYDAEINGFPYRIYEFHENAVAEIRGEGDVDILLIGGGGGGGRMNTGGGGGAGELKEVMGFSLTTGDQPINVGAGGAAADSLQGYDGENTACFGLVALGGGGGGGGGYSANDNYHGRNGANGGGGGGNFGDGGNMPGGSGDPGNDGGNGYYTSTTSNRCGGGGGGTGAPGANGSSSTSGGVGGAGVATNFTGEERWVTGGGAGGSNGGTQRSGGVGGGGAGASSTGYASAGEPNTGSGGGGASEPRPSAASGGSGIVIIRHLI
tara:strand:- start:4247 stop:6088 length:1842 start_codon:yes stop_codon:yes gene_type:complete